MEGEVGSQEGPVVVSVISTAGGSSWCFLCGKRVGTSGRSSTNMFATQTSVSDKPMSSCIATILQIQLQQDQVPSEVICKGCHKSVSNIDELEVQLGELREEVITRHRKTTRLLQAGELPPTDPGTPAASAAAAGDDKSSVHHATPRKTKLTPRADLAEEGMETAVLGLGPTEDQESEPPRKRRGRPPGKRKVEAAQQSATISEEDKLLRRLEAIHSDTLEEGEVAQSGTAEEEKVVPDLGETIEEEEDEDNGADMAADSDPEFIPLDEDDPEFVPKKVTSKGRAGRVGRPRNTEKGSATKGRGGKRRGRRRDPIDSLVKQEMLEEAGDEEEDVEEVEAAPDDPDAVFSCSACEARFAVAGSLIAHLRKKHGVMVLMCDLCGLDFEHREELMAHTAAEHPPDEMEEEEAEEMKDDFDPELDAEGDFQCEICNRLFYSLRALRDHKRVHYGRNYMCEVCHKRFASRALMEEHQNTHTGQRPYECSLCAKTFASKYCLKVHLRIHEVRPRPHCCDMCGKSFMKPEHLAQHQRTHLTQKDYMCGTCGKGFSSARNLEVHAVVHTGYKPFVCRTCGKAFARRAEILDHERIHTGERPFQCETCGATFSQRSNLQSHKRATHLDDRRFVCQACGKSFKRRRLLDYHTRSVHTGERPYACSECNATFVYPEHFKKHRRIHTGEKPFRCEVCGKAFNSRDNRNAHRFIHSNKKPYECLVCGLGFMRKPLLYSHMQAQGHVHDTIVVNQPQVPQAASNVVSEAAAAAGISADKIYVTTQDDPEPHNVEEVGAIEHIVIDTDTPIFVEGSEGEGEQRTHTIYMTETGETSKDGANVQLVQIRLQGSGDQAQWINLSS